MKYLTGMMTVVLLLLLLCGPAAARQDAAPDVVRVGVLGILTDAPVLVAQAKDYFADFNLDVELAPFRSGADALPALVSGDIDVTFTSYSAGLFNAIGRGIDIRFLTSLSRQDERATGSLLVSNELAAEMEAHPEEGLAVLKGRTIAVSGPGIITQAYLYWGLQDVGLTLDDVNVEVLSMPDQVAALSSGAIDAGLISDPVLSVALLQGIGVRERTYYQLYGSVAHDTGILAASANFVETRRDVAVRFMAAYLLGVRDVRQAFVLQTQPIRDEVLGLLQAAIPALADPAVLQHVYTDGGRPNGELDLATGVRSLEAYRALGLIEVDDVDFEAASDTSIAEDALALVGPWDYSAEVIDATPEATAASQ